MKTLLTVIGTLALLGCGIELMFALMGPDGPHFPPIESGLLLAVVALGLGRVIELIEKRTPPAP
jgi:hypothetical protein